jgi:hypothetical protein
MTGLREVFTIADDLLALPPAVADRGAARGPTVRRTDAGLEQVCKRCLDQVGAAVRCQGQKKAPSFGEALKLIGGDAMSAKSLGTYLVLSTAFIFAVFASPALAQGTLYEGARLITGDGRAIEDSSFFVEGNQFTRIGRKGEVALPDGSARIDLTGKTVMPALIDAHVHLGYRKGLDFSPSARKSAICQTQ